ncbi:glycosyltransferase [Microbacterium sp.]|uniref:glycosyltransferase n=1 Tax=unclassified Microbacterium TaxID=2609290 RepID=UPI003567559B
MTYEIFVPFWGDPEQLYETVESVRAQTDPDWRLTVIDDCYPDDSVAAHFDEELDERIIYTRNEHNIGITENFRESVRRASGDFVTILGCDDLLHPNYVAVVRAAARAVPHADVIQPGVQVIDERGAVVLPLVDRIKQRLLTPKGQGITVFNGPDMATTLIRGNWLYWPSLSLRVETLRRIDFTDDLAVIQDLALLMDIAFDGGTLAYTPPLAFSYRRHLASASQKTLLDGSRFLDERRYYRIARRSAAARGWSRTARTARVRLMSRLHGIAALPLVLRHGTARGVRSALAHVADPR